MKKSKMQRSVKSEANEGRIERGIANSNWNIRKIKQSLNYSESTVTETLTRRRDWNFDCTELFDEISESFDSSSSASE